MLSLFILIMIILLLSFNQKAQVENPQSIIINEVMVCPIESDYYNEWIELYNPSDISIDVKNWTIDDGVEKDTIIGDLEHGNGTTIIPPYSYAILTDKGTKAYENFTITENAIKLFVDDSSICGYGLNNNQEKLILSDSAGNIIDAIEWGFDYSDVPGLPAYCVNKGNSLSRYPLRDEDNSILDFYFGITPTPGAENVVDLNVELYPIYISKISKDKDHSIPISIKVLFKNLNSNDSYQLKSFIIGNLSNNWPATQTWNGTSWRYSNEYTLLFTTNDKGIWSGWKCIRFKKDYLEYNNNIRNNSKAYLHVKIKKENISYIIIKPVFLLDMDSSTYNGIKGGYIVGRAEKNNSFLENKTIIVENKTGVITAIYFTEDNRIEDELISKSGYYKIHSPVGLGYNLKFFNGTKLIHSISNLQVKQGAFGVKLNCPETYFQVKRNNLLQIPIFIKNIGNFPDAFNITIYSDINEWNNTLEKNLVTLNPNEMSICNLHVIPCRLKESNTCNITLSSTSKSDIGEFDEIDISIDILAPDLKITNIKCLDNFKEENSRFKVGQTVTVKASVKNLGNENATDVNVSFYFDFLDNEHLIGRKYYESISKYQKYPSVSWDTSNLGEGIHNIFVVVDEKDDIEELNELNNEFSIPVEIYTAHDVKTNVLISEVYYHTHPRLNNEYIAIYNPNYNSIDISGCYITNSPWKNIDEQNKIIFPENTSLNSKNTFYITQNASAFKKETGKFPDFEYDVDSTNATPQMIKYKTLRLSNNGGVVALKDQYNHTLDILVYGETKYNHSSWTGSPINKSGEGVILKRNKNREGVLIDTNCSADWVHPRIFGLGQSDFPYIHFSVTGVIKTFVSPDCSFKTIVDELQNASESIYFNIYEFTNPFLCEELVAALKRNVSVNIFLEGSPVGGIDQREKYILTILKNHGANIRFIVNDEKNNVYARYIFDHGKYLIIDNKTVIVESCNWAKTGVPIDPTFGNREWGILVKNEIIADYFLNVFLDDWNPERCDSNSFDEVDLSVPSGFFVDKTIYKGYYEPEFKSITYNGNFTATPVFSPDTSEIAICDLIESANNTIYIEQLYIYKDWKNNVSPLIKRLINKSNQGLEIKVILNFNPFYEATNEKCNQTKQLLEEHGIEVKFLYTNWSYFTNTHNKGMIVDNRSVLISSINWNENSFTRNREAGIIIENEEIAGYYAEVFLYDWALSQPKPKDAEFDLADYKNQLLIVLIYGFTFAIIARDWRKRRWA